MCRSHNCHLIFSLMNIEHFTTRFINTLTKVISPHSYFWKLTIATWRNDVYSPHFQGDGLQLEYEMKLTNGQSFWTQHFSADEFGKRDQTESLQIAGGMSQHHLPRQIKDTETEQITIIKAWMNKLMTMDQLVADVASEWIVTSSVMFSVSLFSSLNLLTKSISPFCSCLNWFFLPSLFLLHILWMSVLLCK